MPFTIAKQYEVREEVYLPHPHVRSDRPFDVRKPGCYTPKELDSLIESYRELGYRCRRTHDEDGVVTWTLNIGSKVKIVLQCLPYDPMHGG